MEKIYKVVTRKTRYFVLDFSLFLLDKENPPKPTF